MQKLFQKSATLRGWKEQVVGVERIKDDPFENDRRELEEYESLVRVVKSTCEKFHSSLSDASRTHAEMMGALKRFHELNENVSQRRRIESIDLAIDAIGDEFDKGKDEMDQVFRKLEALLEMHTGLAERLKERDKAHASKVHYEEKVAELNAKETDKEKIDRNLKKQKEAKTEYEEKEQITVRECRDALNTKFKDMDQVIGIYIKVLAGYYMGIGDKFSNISSLTKDMITSNLSLVRTGLPPPTTVKAVATAHQAQADEEHTRLRNALGLRMGVDKMSPREQESDNDSDLTTPPLHQSSKK